MLIKNQMLNTILHSFTRIYAQSRDTCSKIIISRCFKFERSERREVSARIEFSCFDICFGNIPLVNYSVYDLRAKINENFIADVKSIGNRGVQFGMKYRFHVSEFNWIIIVTIIVLSHQIETWYNLIRHARSWHLLQNLKHVARNLKHQYFLAYVDKILARLFNIFHINVYQVLVN